MILLVYMISRHPHSWSISWSQNRIKDAWDHGRRSREDRGDKSPPEFGAGGPNANCPHPRFCHIGTKISVLSPSKYAKIRFRPGLCPGPRWGSSRRSPRPLSRLERWHPFPYPTPLGTDPPSALAMRLPSRRTARSTPMLGITHISLNSYQEFDARIFAPIVSIVQHGTKFNASTLYSRRCHIYAWTWVLCRISRFGFGKAHL